MKNFGEYNYYIATISVIILVLSIYVSLSIVARMRNTTKKLKNFWLITSSIILANGIWLFHFCGLLSFNLGVNIWYDIKLTLFSYLLTTLTILCAFYTAKIFKANQPFSWLSSVILAIGLTAMHLTGMKAMIMPVEVSYTFGFTILTFIGVIIASSIVMYLFTTDQYETTQHITKLKHALIMSVAIGAVHHFGMNSATFRLLSTQEFLKDSNELIFIYIISLLILLFLFISWGFMLFDRNTYVKLAFEDPVTGLYNRQALLRYLSSRRTTQPFGLIYIDLDHFKTINDTLGIETGDVLIQKVSKRLGQFHRNREFFRIGGDEFVLISKEWSESEMPKIADEILHAIREPFLIHKNELYITASIGISYGQVKQPNSSQLLRMADTALYHAKKAGKDRCTLYTEEIGRIESRRMRLIKDIKIGVKKKEFFIMYQPQWDVEQNQVYGFEALLRWEHPHLGLVSPMEFIPVAEETGLIHTLTHWVMVEATKQAKAWEDMGFTQRISVNLSTKTFRTRRFVSMVEQAIHESQVNPAQLVLEITESMYLHDVKSVSKQLHEIQALNVNVSLDDFGVGYSSIGVLDQIPINTIKLDRLFAADLHKKNKRAIIEAVLTMAHSLDANVITEGVENEEQVAQLYALGCKVMQGYYFGKPLTVKEATAWLKQQKSSVDKLF